MKGKVETTWPLLSPKGISITNDRIVRPRAKECCTNNGGHLCLLARAVSLDPPLVLRRSAFTLLCFSSVVSTLYHGHPLPAIIVRGQIPSRERAISNPGSRPVDGEQEPAGGTTDIHPRPFPRQRAPPPSHCLHVLATSAWDTQPAEPGEPYIILPSVVCG